MCAVVCGAEVVFCVSLKGTGRGTKMEDSFVNKWGSKASVTLKRVAGIRCHLK